jgi:hypothetical protein
MYTCMFICTNTTDVILKRILLNDFIDPQIKRDHFFRRFCFLLNSFQKPFLTKTHDASTVCKLPDRAKNENEIRKSENGDESRTVISSRENKSCFWNYLYDYYYYRWLRYLKSIEMFLKAPEVKHFTFTKKGKTKRFCR